MLLSKLTANLESIIVDPYGNYAIQHILEIFYFDNIAEVVDYIYENLGELSINKYASNVVEKCLIYSSDVTIHLSNGHRVSLKAVYLRSEGKTP